MLIIYLGCDPSLMEPGEPCSWNQASACFCDDECVENGDCCEDHKTVCSHLYTTATNIYQMAENFKIGSEWADYGCNGRGNFDAFTKSEGKAVDQSDKAFQNWKRCVKCLSSKGVKQNL